jgi:hypothetical protein
LLTQAIAAVKRFNATGEHSAELHISYYTHAFSVSIFAVSDSVIDTTCACEIG